MVKKAPAYLHEVAIDALIGEMFDNEETFANTYKDRPEVFEKLLGHVNLRTSETAARILGLLSPSMAQNIFQTFFDRVQAVVQSAVAGASVKAEVLSGNLAALGFITSQKGSNFLHGSSKAEDLLYECVFCDSLDEFTRSSAVLFFSCAAIGEIHHQEQEMLALLQKTRYLCQSKIVKATENYFTSLYNFLLKYRSDDIMDHSFEVIAITNVSKDDRVHRAAGRAIISLWRSHKCNSVEFLKNHVVDNNYRTEKDKDDDVSEKEAEIRGKLLNFIIKDCIQHTRPEARAAAACWLVTLLKYCSNTREIKERISSIQNAFCLLLGDSRESTQELASKGVALCYEVSGPESKEKLVESLVKTLSGNNGGRKRRAGDVTDDSEIFESGALGKIPGSGNDLTTYKEICSLATDLGQPDLVYKFMTLAGHQASADASRGAAYGMASVAKLAGDALKPYIAVLVPRLYRSTYDPNPKVRESMKHIWINIVDDERLALSQNFPQVLSLLVKDMVGQQWRVRESAAYAAADAIQGRSWIEVQNYFQGLWTSCLRVIDDVKDSVRISGLALARSLSAFSLRLVDPEFRSYKDGKQVLAILVPILVDQGMVSSVVEVKTTSIITISKLVKAAGAEALGPNIKILLPRLLEALRYVF